MEGKWALSTKVMIHLEKLVTACSTISSPHHRKQRGKDQNQEDKNNRIYSWWGKKSTNFPKMGKDNYSQLGRLEITLKYYFSLIRLATVQTRATQLCVKLWETSPPSYLVGRGQNDTSWDGRSLGRVYWDPTSRTQQSHILQLRLDAEEMAWHKVPGGSGRYQQTPGGSPCPPG